jgi:hypothetical protein
MEENRNFGLLGFNLILFVSGTVLGPEAGNSDISSPVIFLVVSRLAAVVMSLRYEPLLCIGLLS